MGVVWPAEKLEGEHYITIFSNLMGKYREDWVRCCPDDHGDNLRETRHRLQQGKLTSYWRKKISE